MVWYLWLRSLNWTLSFVLFSTRDLFLLWFGLFGMGSLVWDLCFETFGFESLISFVRNLRFEIIFALRPVVRDLWFGIFWFVCFGLRSLFWDFGLRSSSFFCGAAVYYLRSGIFGLGSLFGISGGRSLALYIRFSKNTVGDNGSTATREDHLSGERWSVNLSI